MTSVLFFGYACFQLGTVRVLIHLLVVSDLIPEHPCLPSPALAVLAHLHMHGQRSGVELKLDGGRWTAQSHEHTEVGYC